MKKRGDRSHTSGGTGARAPRVTRRPGPLPLGYEASGSGLRRLGRSPLCHLTSASVWEVVVYGALHLSRLSRARRISFTDWFTGVRGSPRAVAGKILPRPRRTVGGEKRGDRSHTRGARGASPRLDRSPGAHRPGARRLLHWRERATSPWGFILSPSATLRVAGPSLPGPVLADGERMDPRLSQTLTVTPLALPGPSLSLRPRRRQ